jgi:predicted ATPase
VAVFYTNRCRTPISKIHELVNKDSQFIIATHSPIIMAYPDSIIYEIKNELKIVKYEETGRHQSNLAYLYHLKLFSRR